MPMPIGTIESEVGYLWSEGISLSYNYLTHSRLKAAADLTTGVLLLHGAATPKGRGRTLFESFQEYLAQNGISSLAFDTRGVGLSEGEYADSTLNNRLIDAETAYQKLSEKIETDAKRLAIIGVSMGGHVVARLVDKHPEWFGTMILVNPAAYGIDAEDKRLQPDTAFSEAIRRPHSWEDSLAFFGVRRFAGRILLVKSENDNVVPSEVTSKYKEAAEGRLFEVMIPIVPHALLSGTDEDAERGRQILYQVTTDFLI